MKDGIRSRVTISPFSAPIVVPTASPVRMPSSGEPVVFITEAARQAESAILAPTERSSPAVRITSVRPEARKNRRLACRSTLSRFDAVRKASLAIDRTTQISSTASSR